ncbi:MAG TPA: acetyl-CoA carboxylase, carboxyltransferase subunit beta [Streptosporangiaceae bacterium]|nr:acetyl-CoA carboxylase, carboxyltransferase subunit beta [Streptosporangiaceae bacterium]
MTMENSRKSGTGAADWVMCPDCGELLYRKRLTENLQVCRECGSHHRLTAAERITQIFDEGQSTISDDCVRSTDVLEFVDSKPYPERLLAARRQTGLREGVLVVHGTIDGNPVIAAVMDFRFLGGSLGGAVGELITRAAELALDLRTPLLIVSASGGARMQEGVISLMQMAKTSQALGRLDEAGILTISLVTDPTYGGVAASYATICDVILAEPGARLGFAGPRVIEQTIRQVLPPGFQTAESLLEHGLIDAVKPRQELRQTLARLLSIGSATEAATETGHSDEASDQAPATEVVERDPLRLPEADMWQTVQRARDLGRPTALELLRTAFDEFEELHGDRVGGDCAAIVGGLARLDGMPVTVIGHQKGATLPERAARNYGMATPSGYRKAARLMRLAAKLRLPVVTLVDTPGAYPGIEAEEQGQAIAIAENIRLMASLPVPVICAITGEGGSGGALALAVANQVLVCSNGTYSVISPEGCASILWHDASKAPAAAAALRVGARELLRLGVVDGVINEPAGGSQADPLDAAARLRTALSSAVRPLRRTDAATLIAERRARFRSFAMADETAATNRATAATNRGRTDEPAYAGRA